MVISLLSIVEFMSQPSPSTMMDGSILSRAARTSCIVFGVDQTHEVESEAVDVVVLRPVGHRVDDVLAHHRTFGGGVVAATGVVDERTVVVIAEVVARDRLVERMVRGIVDVVVHHIHDDADVVLVQALDHLLHFGDAGARVARIGGVRAFRHVVVLRIVAPVLRAIRRCSSGRRSR